MAAMADHGEDELDDFEDVPEPAPAEAPEAAEEEDRKAEPYDDRDEFEYEFDDPPEIFAWDLEGGDGELDDNAAEDVSRTMW